MGSSFSTNVQATQPIRSQELVLYDDASAREAIQHTTCDFVDPDSLVDHLLPGDIIQVKGNFIWQWFYSHFAVFIGNGKIVHATFSGNCIQEKSIIAGAKMVDVFCGELVRKNNHLDNFNNFHIRPIPQIVLTAQSMVGKPWEYNVFTHNCEHFATWCRYGRKISLQSFGIGDVVAGRVSFGEYVACSCKSVMERTATFFSWVRRKTLGFGNSIANVFYPAIQG